MLAKKRITISLMLVLALQLLPVRQAVRYFFIDNANAEEITHACKNPLKNFRLLDEDHFLTDFHHFFTQHFLVKDEAYFHYPEMLPNLFAADIHTPPPNSL